MEHTDDQVREARVERMGLELGSFYHALTSDLSWLYVQWTLHRQLYGTSARRFDILAETAPFFFYVLQRTLWEDILLRVARVTDSPRSCGRRNLSVVGLPPLVEDESIRARLQDVLGQTVDACGFAREWRNRRFAHSDLEFALTGTLEELPAAEVAEVQTALESLADFLNAVAAEFGEAPVAYAIGQFGPGDAATLVSHLSRSLMAKRAMHERPDLAAELREYRPEV